MTKYEFLICNRPQKMGALSSYQEYPGVWGKKEIEPNFKKIVIELKNQNEAKFVLTECKYDFNENNFIHKESNEIFDSSFIVDSLDKETRIEAKKEISKLGLDRGNLCSSEIAYFGKERIPAKKENEIEEDLRQERKYWYMKFIKKRHVPGVKKVLSAIKSGQYIDIHYVFKNMSDKNFNAMIDDLTENEKLYAISLRRGK